MSETAESIEIPEANRSAVIPSDRYAGARQRNHISQHQLGLLLKLHQDNRSQNEIAQILKVDQSTVSKALKRLGADTAGLASHHLRTKAYRASRRVTAIVEKGKDDVAIRAARVVLEAAGVISSANSQIQLGIQVIIGGESQPAIGAGSVQVEALEGTVEPVVLPG